MPRTSYTVASWVACEAKLSLFLSTLFNLHAPYPVAPHLHARIAYSSLTTKLFDGSYLNIALKARHRRRVEADWLGADIATAIAGLA